MVMRLHGWMITCDCDALLSKRSYTRLRTAAARKVKRKKNSFGYRSSCDALSSNKWYLSPAQVARWRSYPQLTSPSGRPKKQLRLTSKLHDFSRDPFTTLFAFEAFTRAHLSRVTDNEHNSGIIWRARGREGNSESGLFEPRGSRRRWCKWRKRIKSG